MKKLYILMFAILILGCGTETPVDEYPESVIEEPAPVVVEDEPLMSDDSTPPQIAAGSVLDGDFGVDPEPLNRDGIVYEFSEDLSFYLIEIFLEGKNLRWHPRDVATGKFKFKPEGMRQFARIKPEAGSLLLEHDTEYTIVLYVQDVQCNGGETVIRFRTKLR